MSTVYKAVNTLNRGRKHREILPGTLFQPTKQQLADFEPMGAIVPASEAEAALFQQQAEAQGKNTKNAIVRPEDAEAAAPDDSAADASADEKPAKAKVDKKPAKKADDADLVG